MKENASPPEIFIPQLESDTGLRATHLGIGAHQDDLEFMAFHGIAECHQRTDRFFGGVICTNGVGSSRKGTYADLSVEELQSCRENEQRAAAQLGDYSFVAQLRYASSEISAPLRSPLVDDLVYIIGKCRPEVIYTHNPADKHPTHIRVIVAVMEALHRMPANARPKILYGCEMWRGLDWMADEAKTVHDVSGYEGLANGLNRLFDSQISGGKRYDLAVMGRRRANATFFDAYSTDEISEANYAMDLSPLIGQPPAELVRFTTDHIDRFRKDVISQLSQTLT